MLSALALSGGHEADPRTPAGLPGLPPVFFGSAVVGSGGETGAVDSYGNVVDLRRPGPAGRAVVAVEPEAQRAGTVDAEDVLVARAARSVLGGPEAIGGRPLWDADAVEQNYVTGTNVLRTVASFGLRPVVVIGSTGGPGAVRRDRRWLAEARPPGPGAPPWARRMFRRALLVLRALTDRRSGAVVAGARQGWAYVWPRDAAAVSLALGAAGFRAEARRVARFLLGLDLDAAARFDGEGDPVAGRAAQGDAAGWVYEAARAAGLADARRARMRRLATFEWRGRADYQEKGPGDYLGNALAGQAVDGPKTSNIWTFSARRRGERVFVREAGDPDSGLDAAAAWAVRPFPHPALFAPARRTLLALAADAGPYGILPSEDWDGGEDPWTAPTAWTAWSLAALGERRAALHLIAALRRAATPLGMLPERVDAETGAPRSTTPLAWSHAFAILALRELWPSRGPLSSPR